VAIERYNKGTYRFYNIEGVGELPSVTTVLGMLPKPKIVLWAVLQTIKFLKERGDLSKTSTSLGFVFHKKLLQLLAKEGTDIHNLIEVYATKGEDSDHDAVKRYKKFEKDSGFVCEKAEIVVWDNEEYKSAGTLDLIGKCSHIPIIWDLKTSKAIRLSHKIQSCIYRDMYCKMHGIDPKEMKSGVLLIPRDAKRKWDSHINSPAEEETYRKIFKLLSALFHILLEIGDLDLTSR
jgi:hypothetical protein